MATTDKMGVKRTVCADVVYRGEELIVPEGMNARQAIDLLTRRMAYEESAVTLNESYDAFPWDGAVALAEVIKAKFGWVPALGRESFFGSSPPQMPSVEIAYGKTINVPWGEFQLPGIEGTIETGTGRKNGKVVFTLVATVKRKYEERVKAFFELVRERLRDHSIYRGQAIKLRFRDDDGDTLELPTVQFMDVSGVDENQLVFSDAIQAAVNTNLFTPIRRARACIANGIPLKRGVLLGGTYGCGKTLAAVVASRIAVDNGITFIYCERADELGDAVEFAKQYQSPAAVVFVEDIDRSMSGERSVEMDAILNVVDGIESKKNNIIVVLTSNDLQSINAAMLRPGRLDAVIEIAPPDGKAVERLLRNYGGAMVAPDTDLSAVGRELQGNIPAVIAEVVKRAKLSQLALQPAGDCRITTLTAAALLEAARTMAMQIALLRRDVVKPADSLEQRLAVVFHDTLANGGANGVAARLERIEERLS